MSKSDLVFTLFTYNMGHGKKYYIADYRKLVATEIIIEFTSNECNAGRFPEDICEILQAQFEQMGITIYQQEGELPIGDKPLIEKRGRCMYGIRIETFSGTRYYKTRTLTTYEFVAYKNRAARLCKDEAARVLEAISVEYLSATVFEYPIIGGA